MTQDERLQGLGLSIDGSTAAFELGASRLLNPLSRRFIDSVTFLVLPEGLAIQEPSALRGTPPFGIEDLDSTQKLAERVARAFESRLLEAQRASVELQSLGLAARVDPESIQVELELDSGEDHFQLVSAGPGRMEVRGATRKGKALVVPPGASLEIGRFQDPAGLVGYVSALFAEEGKPTPVVQQRISFDELRDLFGGSAGVPLAGALELTVDVVVGGKPFRFAAARLKGRLFRGLLANSEGKIWAERFALDDFPGVRPLVASLLNVAIDDVQVLGDEGGEG